MNRNIFDEQVRNTIRKFGLLKKGEKIVLALSGGPDSTALLFVLNALKGEYNLKLHIAYLDHMFRAKVEAKKDYDYILNLANRLKMPFSLGRTDVPRYSKDKGLSLEEAARELRYEFLSNVTKDVGAKRIALGHTLDDQAETVLMRLIRGTGLSGLRGIPPKRKLDGQYIIRPLIEVWRKDIDAYLRSLKIKPREDVTNLMPAFLRNRIRHELIPYLEKFNPNIKEVLARNAQNLSYDYEALASATDAGFKKCSKRKAGAVEIKLRILNKKPIGLRRQILRKAIEESKGNLRRIDYAHIEKIEDLIDSKKGSLDLPDKIRAKISKGSIIFYKLKDELPQLSIYRELSIPGKTIVPESNLLFEAKFVSGKIKYEKSKRTEYFDYDKLKYPLYVRTWQKGDRFKPLGMTAEKKLQDFFVDEKVPKEKRDSIPLVISGKKIIWVCGLRISDDVKLTPTTKRILKLTGRVKKGRSA